MAAGSAKEGPPSSEIDRDWLFVLAITIDNLPEGLAVGIGFDGGKATIQKREMAEEEASEFIN